MPITFTDDIAPLLASALEGPFKVVHPTDAASYLQIDPANAKIAAAGAARPTRRSLLPLSRKVGTATPTNLGTAIEAMDLGPSTDGGMYLASFMVPPEMDVGATSKVCIVLTPVTNGGGNVVRIELATTYGKHGDTSLTNEQLLYDWTTPSNWTTEDVQVVAIDNGNGVTFAANKFEAGDVVGLRIQRLGSAAADTYPNNVLVAATAIFEYTAKQI